tara:strand:- start:6072 stop:7031 length:960 start_codon:yes stop_codon:yes gene_type:complete
MKGKKNFSNPIVILFNGILMGTANKIPGISGGLVALALGFYKDLIFSLKRFDNKALKILLNLEFNKFYEYINGKFLIMIVLGIVISYFSTSKILEILLINYELYVWSLFFGLVIGTIFHLKSLIKLKNFKNIFFIVFGALIGFAISLINPAQENDNLYFVFICGIVSVSGMILPGLSGSFILILMGNYVLLLVDSVNALYDSLNELIRGDFSNVNSPERINYLKVLSVFTFGSITGLISLSKILSYLLSNFNQICNSIIFGFIIGSLGVLWPWKSEFNSDYGNKLVRYFPELNSETFYAILFIIIGMFTVIVLSKYEKN